MNIVGVIPARLSSSRLPNKPLADINGITMVGHVYFRSKLSNVLNEVYVATCDQEIVDYCDSIRAKAIMTDDTHERASDRTAEAILKIEETTGMEVDIVVMIQGDEPMITPEMVDLAVNPVIENPDIHVTNLMGRILTVEEFEDPAEVKVVVDNRDNALYFSREPVPSRKKGITEVPMFKQVCIIPFRKEFLMKYNQREQTPLEVIESIDMNRIIENGIPVKMVRTDELTYSVDTQEDLETVRRKMLNDPLITKYS